MNDILMRRKNKVIVSKGTETSPNNSYIVTIMKNVENLGYTFSGQLFKRLQSLSIEELQSFYIELIPILKSMIGANVVYKPMYPNFPRSVMKYNELELYLNAMIHYWSNGTLYPDEKKNKRLPLFDETKVKVIDLGTEDDLRDIFFNLCQSKTSISQSDKDDLEWIFKKRNIEFPDNIPLKENIALVGKLYLENAPLAQAKDIQRYFRTATDVLRLITAMSDGDTSLATNTKFRSFKRKERRLILELLCNCDVIEEDMLRYKNRWIRVGERLHPKEYDETQYGKAITAFDKLRNGVKIETFAGKVTKSILEENDKETLSLLKKRPGELARKLDYLLRITEDKNAVIEAFNEVVANVATPVLLQVREHFAHRENQQETRVFFPKGNLARSYAIKNNLPIIGAEYCESIVLICENALIENYRAKECLGKVYLAEEFKNHIIPFSQRSASKSLKTMVRGSKISISKNTNVLRAFIWWTNNEEDYQVDIDLSAAIFDENWNYKEHVSYTNLYSSEYQAVHSGDVTNGGLVDGDGVSEFLDVDIESIAAYGARYVVYQVYNYSGQKYSDLTHAMFGWMNRNDVSSGEIYEPKTVEQKMDLVSRSIVCIPVVFDCVTREIIWCDMNLSLDGCYSNIGGNNVESNITGVAATCYSIVNMIKPNLYDLINLHIKARGTRVENKKEADIIFDIDSGITPYDTEVFMGEYI
ncbi:TerD family protein [Anaerosporobacter sp.]|uniref:TerD family protein n=1 Tax=Anaerosporobacter sp. TaxID=1872529 RepID=UPI00286F1B59|nr:TerD family protein [Anaerosporobacter sp.]